MKIGFRKDGRITALDGFVVVDNGPYDVVSDSRSAGDHISLCYQPMAMRWRMLTVLTNTPPRGAQRAPGGLQGNALMAPIMAKAARKLGIDEVAIHRINAPEGKAPFGALNARGKQNYTTSAFLKHALDKGAELFNWEERKARSGTAERLEGARRRRRPSAPTRPARWGSTACWSSSRTAAWRSSPASATSAPNRCSTCHRVAAELLGVPWEKCDVTWGNTRRTCRTPAVRAAARRRTR